MASYQVNFACGHNETMFLNGPLKERQRKIEYLEQYGRCSDCRRTLDAEMAAKKANEKGTKVPALLADGRKFNGTIYGRENYYSIYLDGEKIMISNDQAAEIREYLAKI